MAWPTRLAFSMWNFWMTSRKVADTHHGSYPSWLAWHCARVRPRLREMENQKNEFQFNFLPRRRFIAVGPISSSFVNRYGCRVVTIAGSILASACLLMSVYAQNVLTLILTIGIGTGFGLGLIYLPAIVSVTTYFDKYRSLATGIAVCGSGFGTFIFAPLLDFFIKGYHWRGALLILSGTVLNCAIFGALFRPLKRKNRPIDVLEQPDTCESQTHRQSKSSVGGKF